MQRGPTGKQHTKPLAVRVRPYKKTYCMCDICVLPQGADECIVYRCTHVSV